jgi:hypothetical protein
MATELQGQQLPIIWEQTVHCTKLKASWGQAMYFSSLHIFPGHNSPTVIIFYHRDYNLTLSSLLCQGVIFIPAQWLPMTFAPGYLLSQAWTSHPYLACTCNSRVGLQ